MQYKYRYTTRFLGVGEVEFDDFFQALHFMNKHAEENQDVNKAQIVDVSTHRIVCWKRTLQ